MPPATVINAATEEEFIRNAVVWMIEHIEHALGTRNECIIGLCGGSTPRPIYEKLGTAPLDWSNVRIFLVDDRYIDATDPSSNQYLVRSSLLAGAAIPEENIIFPKTAFPIDECVEQYAIELDGLLSEGPADIMCLGLGEDGHIASLFPPLDESILITSERVVHTTTERFDVFDRISVTLPVIRAADNIAFFLKGDGKKKTWEQMIADEAGIERWPAKAVTDRAAAITYW